jgi:hypothetical protein
MNYKEEKVMKYNLIDLTERNTAAELKKYTFEELKNFFEPNEEELPDEWDKWSQIDDLYDLKEYLSFLAQGMAVHYEFEEIPEDIDILIADGCTKEEAKKNLKDGSIVFEDLEENLENYLKEWAYLDNEDDEEKFTDEVKKMVETKTPIPDWGVVEVCGKWYYIQYCL